MSHWPRAVLNIAIHLELDYFVLNLETLQKIYFFSQIAQFNALLKNV